MDLMLDIVAQLGFEWIFDKVEKRLGTAAAWFVTLSLFALFVGAVIAIVMAAI